MAYFSGMTDIQYYFSRPWKYYTSCLRSLSFSHVFFSLTWNVIQSTRDFVRVYAIQAPERNLHKIATIASLFREMSRYKRRLINQPTCKYMPFR